MSRKSAERSGVKKSKSPKPSVAKPAASRIHFIGLGLLRLEFKEVSATVDASTASPDQDIHIGVEARIGTVNEEVGDLTLCFTITPNRNIQPYNLVVEVIGRFAISHGSRADLISFCKSNAPGILFPYVRQLVHSATAHARHGPVQLPLMNMQGLLPGTGWEEQPPTGD